MRTPHRVLAALTVLFCAGMERPVCLPPEGGGLSCETLERVLENALQTQGAAPPPEGGPPWTDAQWRAAMRSVMRRGLERAGALDLQLLLFPLERRQPVPPPVSGEGAEVEGPIFAPVAPETLWRLVAPGDMPVFKRGVVHMSTVFAVDRENAQIFLVDPWPKSFLLPRFDLVPVSEVILNNVFADHADKLLVRLSRSEFERRIVYLYRIGNSQLPEVAMAAEPGLRDDAHARLAFGLAFQAGAGFADWPDLSYSSNAETEFAAAASAANDHALRAYAEEKLRFSRLVVQSLKGDASDTDLPDDPDALFSLALASGLARDYPTAITRLDRALAARPEWPRALAARAVARRHSNDVEGAIADARRTLQYAAEAAAQIDADAAADDVTDVIGRHLTLDAMRRVDFLAVKVMDDVLLELPGTTERQRLLEFYVKLDAIHDSIAAWIPRRMLLWDEEAMLRAAAARKLGEHADPKTALSPLAAALACDSSWNVRDAAANALHWLGPVAAMARPQLAAALLDPNFDVRYKAKQRLDELGDGAVADTVLAARGAGEDVWFGDAIAALAATANAAGDAGRRGREALLLVARGVCTPDLAPWPFRVPPAISQPFKNVAKVLEGGGADAVAAHGSLREIMRRW